MERSKRPRVFDERVILALGGKPVVWEDLTRVSGKVGTDGSTVTIHLHALNNTTRDEKHEYKCYAPWRLLQVILHGGYVDLLHKSGNVSYNRLLLQMMKVGLSMVAANFRIRLTPLAYSSPITARLGQDTVVKLELLNVQKNNYTNRTCWYTSDGELLGMFESKFMLTDMKTKKVADIPQNFYERLSALAVSPSSGLTPPKMVAPPAGARVTHYKVTERDMDINNHVSALVYFYATGIAVEQTPKSEKSKEREIHDMETVFVGDFRLGDTMVIRTFPDSSVADIFHVDFRNLQNQLKAYMRVRLNGNNLIPPARI